MINLMVFFEGAVGYSELRNMPYPELTLLHEQATKIGAERIRKSK